MAWDEALLRAVPQFGRPVLRLYAWNEPAATFGYFQRIADAERLTPLRPLIRRPTGGGLVAHDGDWTYSLAFPPEDCWYGLKAIESYRRVHAWIQAAFARAGLLTELSAGASKEAVGQCFSRAERFDLLWQQRKIAGAAQRRSRDGLLIQGSIQPPSSMNRAEFEQAFCDVAQADWGVQWQLFEVETALLKQVRELARNKYSRREYNGRR